MRSIALPIILGATVAFVCLAHSGLAQEIAPAPKSPPANKQSEARALNPMDKQPSETQALNQSIQELNSRVGTLAGELKQFKTNLAEVTTLWRLMLQEQRQAFLEQQLNQAQAQVRDLDSQDAAIRHRLQNLSREYIVTGSAFITQEQARQQIREQLERQLQQIAMQRPNLKEQEQQWRDQVDQLKRKMEQIQRELEIFERKREERQQQDAEKEQ
jgi:chromosome segregation ATPase